jgi:hypothetical protein
MSYSKLGVKSLMCNHVIVYVIDSTYGNERKLTGALSCSMKLNSDISKLRHLKIHKVKHGLRISPTWHIKVAKETFPNKALIIHIPEDNWQLQAGGTIGPNAVGQFLPPWAWSFSFYVNLTRKTLDLIRYDSDSSVVKRFYMGYDATSLS